MSNKGISVDLNLKHFVLEAIRSNNGEPLDYEAALAMLRDFVDKLKEAIDEDYP